MSQDLQFTHEGTTYSVSSDATKPNTVVRMPEGAFTNIVWSDDYPPQAEEISFTRSAAGRIIVEAKRVGGLIP